MSKVQEQPLSIAAFCSPLHLGNIHNVQFANGLNKRQSDNVIDVEVTPLQSDLQAEPGAVQTYNVVCSQNNYVIQFCGSGLLAAARFVMREQIDFCPTHLIASGRRVEVLRKKHMLGFKLAYPKHQQLRHKRLWRQLVGQSVREVYGVGGHKGYAVVILKHAYQVRNARVKLHLQKMLSARAIILSAPGAKCGEFVFRYFAPQYGNDEDAATGSAFSLLLPYWAKKMGCHSLRAVQLSAQGGLFFGGYAPPYVKLFGYADLCKT